MEDLIINFDRPRERANFRRMVDEWRGVKRVTVKAHRKRRTDRQNRMYWPCVVQPFTDFLQSQGETYTENEAHELMKAKFLMRDVIDPRTGEVIGQVPRSTTDLNTEEFYDYVEKCVAWLADMFGIVCPSPDLYRKDSCENRATPNT